jgi:hypothetical protein
LFPDVVKVIALAQGCDNGQGLSTASGHGGTVHAHRMVHGCGAQIDHESRVAKRAIKIRNQKRPKTTYGTPAGLGA